MKARIITNQKPDYRAFFSEHLKMNSAEDAERLEKLFAECAERTDGASRQDGILEVLSLFDEILWKGASGELFGDSPTEKELSKAMKAISMLAQQKTIRLAKLNKKLERMLKTTRGE